MCKYGNVNCINRQLANSNFSFDMLFIFYQIDMFKLFDRYVL